jgi:glucose-6-phosphate isomerase
MIIGNTIYPSPALQQLVAEDAVGQLRRHEGLMATLGSENGSLKLDWVEGVARLLEDDSRLEEIETEAREIWERGIRHIIWSGMGGSIIAVRVLADLGFFSSHNGEGIAIYSLDSTDPTALNEIVRKIAWAKDITLSDEQELSDPPFMRTLLDDVMMVGVSMGMTSEEPITHMTWFIELLEKAQIEPQEHLLVMTLPGSYLELFAHERQVPSTPLQLDGGTGTGGRMSAPTTRVFLLPAALFLTRLSDEPDQLRAVLRQAWEGYNLALATTQPADHAFVQLAAALSDASTYGACRMLLKLPEEWQAFVPWVEQLMEESLGKGGKGVIVFDDQTLDKHAPAYRTNGTLKVRIVTDPTELLGSGESTSTATEYGISPQTPSSSLDPTELLGSAEGVSPLPGCGVPPQTPLYFFDAAGVESQSIREFVLFQPSLANQEPLDRLAALAASFLGWQLSMSLYGYLHCITFAGQPAVENYKSRARALRNTEDPSSVLLNWQPTLKDGPLTLFAPQGADAKASPALVFAQALQQAVAANNERVRLGYLDFTINGEPPESLLSVIDVHMHTIGNELLGVPVKLRRAPAAYHSTEQSEMDGPSYLVSLRLLTRNHEESILGTYSDTFLVAQAVSTWQAMIEKGRTCFLLIMDESAKEAVRPLNQFFQNVEANLRKMLST